MKLKELKAKAKECIAHDEDWFFESTLRGEGYEECDIQYILAVSPKMVLKLIKRIEEYERVLKKMGRVKKLHVKRQ